jgi:hypothetical protein
VAGTGPAFHEQALAALGLTLLMEPTHGVGG